MTRYLHGQATLGEWEGGAKGTRNISLQMTLNGSAIIRSESKTKAIRHLQISHNAPYLPPPPPPQKEKKKRKEKKEQKTALGFLINSINHIHYRSI